MFDKVMALFREYMGAGLITGWFLLAVVYLLFREKRKPVRILFLYVPIILLLIFFNPLFAKLVYRFVGDEIYYRILWLMPMTPVIACAAVNLYGSLKGRARLIFAAAACLLVMLSGGYIYGNRFFHPAENLYHVPQAVVEICDAIEVEGREVTAVFPVELLQYVRQYSPVVCMPYGREITVDRWGNNHELYDVMEASLPDAGLLAGLARENSCNYLILSDEKELKGELTDYGYTLLRNVLGYDIYLDESNNPAAP